MRRAAILSALLAAFAAAGMPVCAQQTRPPEPAGVEVLVYKKWIGASGDEADVEAHLVCEDGPTFKPLRVNRGKPGGWPVEAVPPDGVLCSVYEVERDSFVADMDDCRDLLVLPGHGAECTLVNTKVVKRIDMLNRYGMVLMILVMLGAGLAAVQRYAARP